MERSCSVIVVLFVRKLQDQYTIRRRFSCFEVFEWTRLVVKCQHQNWQLKVPCAKFRVDPSLQIIWLYSAASPGVFFAVYHSRLTCWRFVIVLFHRQDRSHYRQASPRSSRPKSIGFLIGPWPPARPESYRTLHFTRSYMATRTKNKAQNPQHKQTRQRIYKAVRTAGGSTCMNAIFKLSITLLTSS